MQKVETRQGENGPELHFPTPFNVAVPFIDRHVVEGRGKKSAILSFAETVDYETLAANVNRYGNALLRLGLHPGERMLMVIKDAPEFFYAFWGAVKTGIIPVPLNTMLTPPDYAFIISDSGAKALVYSEEFRAQVDAALDEGVRPAHLLLARHGGGCLHDLAAVESSDLNAIPASADDECFWLYSSGTTGRPKGVIHVHQDIVATCQLYAVNAQECQESDIFYSIPRLFFAFGLGCAMTFPLWVGGTVVLDTRRPTPDISAEIFRAFKPTVFAAVPTYLAALLASSALGCDDLKSLRRCVSGGEALPEELQRRWTEIAPVAITDGVGSTEALHTYICNRIGQMRANTSGKPVPGYQVKIIDEQGNEVLDDRTGRLWVKGPSVTRRYWNNPEKTAVSIQNGWLDTGDTYRRDEDGYYYFCGRNDDMLKVGGIWVAPFEIESTLISHPDVLEAAVVARADDAGLVKPEAWIVLKDPSKQSEALAEKIRDFCKKEMAPYKYPRWIHFVEYLPKTATGKIQRFRLRTTN